MVTVTNIEVVDITDDEVVDIIIVGTSDNVMYNILGAK